MNALTNKTEEQLQAIETDLNNNETIKKEIKIASQKVESPLIRYFDLVDESSSSYVLGYN